MGQLLTYDQRKRTFTAVGMSFYDVEFMHNFRNPHFRLGWLSASVKHWHQSLVEARRLLRHRRDKHVLTALDQQIADLALALDYCARADGDDYLRPEV